MSTHLGVKDTDFDVEDSTKPQLEPIKVQLADDLVKLSDGYQDPSQVIDGGVDPEASIDLRRGARPRTLTVREKAFKLEGVKKTYNVQGFYSVETLYLCQWSSFRRIFDFA